MNVLYVKTSTESATPGSLIQSLCDFYGLSLTILEAADSNFKNHFLEITKTIEPKAIVVTWAALHKMVGSSNFVQLVRSRGLQIPVLVVVLTDATESERLNKISSERMVDFKFNRDRAFLGNYKFANLKEITREFSGLVLKSEFTMPGWFETNENTDVKSIIQITGNENDSPYRIFIQIEREGVEIFYLCLQQDFLANIFDLEQPSINQDWVGLIGLAMFLRYACGDYCWHSPGHYANLSIDDPWLIEPYGYVSYSGLLRQMEKANFHTTISLIPWNYDRSEPEVVSLFRENPDKFSICIHGNNHDHYEFFKYRTNLNDPWKAKSIRVHENNIKQAIARMEEFKLQTGISFDRVMVFPHGIAPEQTLELLKKYNFLATLNINHIPLGSKPPRNLIFFLRPYTLKFGNFLSIKRLALWTKSEIVLQLFLGNPLLFSGHHNLFEKGIDSFNETAQLVNHIQPNVQWTSLGEIARHMYLLKRRNENSFDVRTFSKFIDIKNKLDREIMYHFRTQESFFPRIIKITINGISHPYERSGNDLSFSFSIPQGESRLICIEHENNLQLDAIDISKNNSRANRLRRFSDFRDMTLIKYSWGRVFIKGYYGSGAYKLKLKRLVIYFLLMIAVAGSSMKVLLKRRHKEFD